MRRLSCLIASMILLVAASRSPAWNHAGHMTVAKLAWDQLTAQERVALYDLLKDHPHWDKFFTPIAKPKEVSDADFHFALAATWPDWLRNFAKNKDADAKKIYLFHKGPRHYINWPFILPRDAEMFKDKEPSIPDTKENIVKGIDTVMAELGDAKFSTKYRSVSLCWLLHLAGDIHQPLHNIGLLSKYSPTGDQGGNLFWVKENGVPTRLHGYWDDLLGRQEQNASAYEAAVAKCAYLTREQFTREKFEKELKRLTVEEWSKDAFELAVEFAYGKGDLQGRILSFGKDTDAEKAKAPELPAGYRDAALEVAHRQAALAGHRLADLLKKAAVGPK